MENKNYKYEVKITLMDNTVIITKKEYDWDDYADKLSNTNNSFVNINDVIVNKNLIKTIIVTEIEKKNFEKEGED